MPRCRGNGFGVAVRRRWCSTLSPDRGYDPRETTHSPGTGTVWPRSKTGIRNRALRRERTRDLDTPALVSGSANSTLADKVAEELGITRTETKLGRFPDGELDVAVDPVIADSDLYVMQSLSPPVNDHLVELLLLLDACRREHPSRTTVVVPYLGYARKDRRMASGEAVGLRLIADLLDRERVDRLVLVDPHVSPVESIFDVPVETVSAVSVVAEAIRVQVPDDTTVVAPDVGAMKLAQSYADALGLSRVGVAFKDRQSGKKVDVSGLVGDGLANPALLVDDMITTGGTIAAVAEAITHQWRPSSLMIAATHAVLVDDAVDRIERISPSVVAVTDTIEHESLPGDYEVASVSGLLAEVISGDA